MFKNLLFTILLVTAFSAIEKGYTIISPREYRNEYFGANDNTSHVIIGTYLNQKGNVDGIKIAETPYQFNLNLNEGLRGKTRYHKVFGYAENYENLLINPPDGVASAINNNNVMKAGNSYVVVDWDHKIFETDQSKQTKEVEWLKKLLGAISNSILKIPADYLCKTINGSPLYTLLNHKFYIIQLYGNNNPYLTYESIFTLNDYPNETNGYFSNCPKNPSTTKLKQILGQNKFFIQKTLNSENKGYVGEMQPWLDQAGLANIYTGVVFFDQHPKNMIKI